MDESVNVFWSDEDDGYIAVDQTRPGCSAWGETESDVRRELKSAQRAWDEARAAMNEMVGRI